jgi:hypothetical protein
MGNLQTPFSRKLMYGVILNEPDRRNPMRLALVAIPVRFYVVAGQSEVRRK